MAKITGVVTKVDATVLGGVPIQNKVVAADINEIVEVVNLNSDISDDKADLINGKLDVNQLPDLAITSVVVVTETDINSFSSNSGNYTFEQGDVIILDNGNGTFFMYNGGDKSLNDSYNEISSTEIDWSQVVNTPTTIGGYNISDAYTKTEVDGLVSDGAGALEFITEAGNTGIAIKGRNTANYGDIGKGAVDLSFSNIASNTIGATGIYSFASGFKNTAGNYSLVSGNNNIGVEGALVSGSNNTGSQYSLVSGNNNIGADYSLISGLYNTGGNFSLVSGRYNTVGKDAFGAGIEIFAPSYAETTLGMFGTNYTPKDTNTYDSEDRIFSLGNGTDENNRSDALTVYKSGNATLNGDLTADKFIGDGSQLTNVDAATVDGKDINDYLPLIGGTLTNTLSISKPIVGGVGGSLRLLNDVNSPSLGHSTSIEFLSGINGNDGLRILSEATGQYGNKPKLIIQKKDDESVFSDLYTFENNGDFKAPKTITDVLQLTPTTQPSSPAKGMVYYDSGTDLIRYYNGTTWRQVTTNDVSGIVPNSDNWDNIRVTGNYTSTFNVTVGTPVNAGSMAMTHIQTSSDSASQQAVRVTSSETWIRTLFEGTWSAWQKITMI